MPKALAAGLIGSTGRLGSAIIALQRKDRQWRDTLRFTHQIHHSNLEASIDGLAHCSVILDVSQPEATIHILQTLLKKKSRVPYVVGCTGWSSSQLKWLRSLGKKHRIVFAPNFSPGVNLFLNILEQASVMANDWGYKVFIEETHHAQKKDAPSGTAKAMIERLGLRAKPNVSSIRTGKIVGIHEARFTGPEEILTIKHEAMNRAVFARGALIAAHWAAAGKKTGFFSMKDVLDLKANS